jgi:hypothetical protein
MASLRWVLGIALLGTGCYGPPQSRPAFITLAQDGALGTELEAKTVPVSFDSVVAVIEERASECHGVGVRVRRYGAQVGNTDTYYLYEFARVGDDRAELTVRVLSRPGNVGEPKDGAYYLAVDLEREPSGHTKMDLYSGSAGHKALRHAVRQWLMADPVKCPVPS